MFIVKRCPFISLSNWSKEKAIWGLKKNSSEGKEKYLVGFAIKNA